METVDIYKRQIKIYCLKNPISNEIRYIGKTIRSLEIRLKEHIHHANSNNKKKYRVHFWIKSLNGIKPNIELLEICNENDWEEREKFYISKYNNLTNLALGGKSIHGYALSNEHKLKISIANKGKEVSKEAKEKMRKSRLNVQMSETWKNNISKGLMGRKRNNNECLNISKGLLKLNRKLTDAQKKHLRDLNLNKKHSLDIILKKSKPLTKSDLNNNILETFKGVWEVLLKYPDYSKSGIANACSKKRQTYKSYIWSYINKDIVES
jgi:hypothetical protein